MRKNGKLALSLVCLSLVFGAFQNCGTGFAGGDGASNNGYVYEGRPDEFIPDKMTKVVNCTNEAKTEERVFITQMYYNDQVGDLQAMAIREYSKRGLINDRSTAFGRNMFKGYQLAPGKTLPLHGRPIIGLSMDLPNNQMVLRIRKVFEDENGKFFISPTKVSDVVLNCE